MLRVRLSAQIVNKCQRTLERKRSHEFCGKYQRVCSISSSNKTCSVCFKTAHLLEPISPDTKSLKLPSKWMTSASYQYTQPRNYLQLQNQRPLHVKPFTLLFQTTSLSSPKRSTLNMYRSSSQQPLGTNTMTMPALHRADKVI